jgi:phosphomannomutase
LATPIKFGTDGWRAIIAAEFTVENVARVTEATGLWLKERFENPSVVLGHDCRFAGELFMETAAKVLLAQGIHVKLSRGFVSTPMISLAANQLGCEVGIILTASHNPPSYNGFKLKAKFGGPLEPEKINEVEALIPDSCSIDFNSIDLQAAQKSGQLEEIDIETRYINHVKANFDLAAIDQSGLHLMYDAMYGAGQRVMPLILPKVSLLHCEHNPSFMGTAPEPIAKNLQELAQTIKSQNWPNITMQQLSMGMSGDYQLAVQAGATMVRLGTILFGERA